MCCFSPTSCQKTVLQHHEHAKQRLRDELQAQLTAEINQQVAAHTEATEQLRSVAVYDLDNSSEQLGTESVEFYVIIFYHTELEIIKIGTMWMAWKWKNYNKCYQEC